MKKKLLLLTSLIVLAVATILGVGAQVGAWGPTRPTFTWANPADYATFNSITDNPTLGDERNFVRIREAGVGTFTDEVDLKVGKEYEVYIYFHNNARPSIGMTPAGYAQDVRMHSTFPSRVLVGERKMVTGRITTADANPKEVWDEAYVNSSQDVYLRFVPASIIMHNGGDLNGRVMSDTALFGGEGHLLGFNTFSGIVPGCGQYAGYVTYKFKVDKPDFTIAKTVASTKGEEFGESVKAKPGDIIRFRILYTNTGTMDQKDVHIFDRLPDGLTYVPGTAVLRNNSNPEGKAVNDDVITNGGMNIGTYGWGAFGELTFSAQVNGRESFGSCGENSLRNVGVGITGDGEKSDDAWVKVEVECQPDECRPGIPKGDPRCEEEPETPCTPGDPECPITTPPGELPKTGPAEVVLAAVVIAAIGVAATYWIRSRKLVKSAQNASEGRDKDGNLSAGNEKVEKSDKAAKNDKVEEGGKDADKGTGLES